MERRGEARAARRIPVRFEIREKRGHVHRGYAGNISRGGMFIGTASPQPSGTRLRIEVGPKGGSFILEGVVAHSRRLAPELRAIGTSGMGVRFLSVSELVAELLGEALEEEDDEVAESDSAEAPGRYRIRLRTDDEFLLAYRRDLVHDGIFIPTRRPANLDDRVTVVVELPEGGPPSLRFTGRVVQILEPRGEAGGDGDDRNLLAGIGVAFDTPLETHAAFKSVAQALGAE